MIGLPSLRRCKAAHLRFGRLGERIATSLVRSLGMTQLCTNYDGPRGEIDLVALDGEVLCFIEVKSRKPRANSRPADAVTLKKKWAIVQTAKHYLNQLNHPKLAYRFDVVEVIMTNRRLVELRYWPSDFTVDDVRPMMRAR
jgi:putative endonuclease